MVFFAFSNELATYRASLVAQLVKNQPAMRETWVQSLGWEDPLEGNGYPLQYSGLKNSMDCIVHGVPKSRTRLSYFHSLTHMYIDNMGFPGSSAGKESTCSARDPSSIPGSERSAGEGTGYRLQYSGLKNSMDCMVHGVAKSWT